MSSGLRPVGNNRKDSSKGHFYLRTKANWLLNRGYKNGPPIFGETPETSSLTLSLLLIRIVRFFFSDPKYRCRNMRILVDRDKCRGSGECVKVCPQDAITLVDGIAVVDDSKCDLDGMCIPACPHGAISFSEEKVE